MVMCLCIAACCINYSNASSFESITYNLSPMKEGNPILNIEVILNGDIKDELVLNLPSHWAGINYTEQIKNIKTSPEYNIDLVNKDDSYQAIIKLPKIGIQELKFNYEVHQKTGDPADVHEAIIRNDIVHAPGYGILTIPNNLDDDDKIHVVINWLDLDPNHHVISSHGITHKIDKKMTAFELMHAVYAAGNIRLHQIAGDKAPVYLSLFGKFDFDDDKIIVDLKQIIDS